MQALIRNAKALAPVGEYDFKGPKGEIYRFLDLYDAEQGGVVRLSLAADCNPPQTVDFGTALDVWCELVQGEKIVRGEDRDRALKNLKLRAVDVQLAKAATNGAVAPAPAVKAAA